MRRAFKASGMLLLVTPIAIAIYIALMIYVPAKLLTCYLKGVPCDLDRLANGKFKLAFQIYWETVKQV